MEEADISEESWNELLRSYGGGFALFIVTILAIPFVPAITASASVSQTVVQTSTTAASTRVLGGQMTSQQAIATHAAIIRHSPSFTPASVEVSIVPRNSQTIEVAGVGQPGVGYILEGSGDLVNWELLTVSYPNDVNLAFELARASNPHRFFRVAASSPTVAATRFALATGGSSTVQTVVDTGQTAVTGILGMPRP